MHNSMLSRVLNAKISFFMNNTIGNIMNRYKNIFLGLKNLLKIKIKGFLMI